MIMRLTDIFILRPVLAIVVSVFILLLGLRAEQALPLREYPRTVNALIQIDTSYYGADAATVAGFITTPLENAIAQANGIDYMTSISSNGTSTITLAVASMIETGVVFAPGKKRIAKTTWQGTLSFSGGAPNAVASVS